MRVAAGLLVTGHLAKDYDPLACHGKPRFWIRGPECQILCGPGGIWEAFQGEGKPAAAYCCGFPAFAVGVRVRFPNQASPAFRIRVVQASGRPPPDRFYRCLALLSDAFAKLFEEWERHHLIPFKGANRQGQGRDVARGPTVRAKARGRSDIKAGR